MKSRAKVEGRNWCIESPREELRFNLSPLFLILSLFFFLNLSPLIYPLPVPRKPEGLSVRPDTNDLTYRGGNMDENFCQILGSLFAGFSLSRKRSRSRILYFRVTLLDRLHSRWIDRDLSDKKTRDRLPIIVRRWISRESFHLMDRPV